MKFQLISDLHLEYYDTLPNLKKFLIPKAPILILAGDICFIKHKLFVPFFQKLSKMFKKIIYVFGNHEYFTNKNHKMDTLYEMELFAREKLIPFKNVHILQKSYIIIDNVVILGCTLWSYLSKKDLVGDISHLTNTAFIRYRNRILINPKITNKIHFSQKQWLQDKISQFSHKKVIVVTHYLPTIHALDHQFHFFRKAYYSNCDEMVKDVSVWCAGHIHSQKNNSYWRDTIVY